MQACSGFAWHFDLNSSSLRHGWARLGGAWVAPRGALPCLCSGHAGDDARLCYTARRMPIIELSGGTNEANASQGHYRAEPLLRMRRVPCRLPERRHCARTGRGAAGGGEYLALTGEVQGRTQTHHRTVLRYPWQCFC